MIIIVEGVDNSGKGYAIERIGKHLRTGIILKNLYKPKDCDDLNIYDRYKAILNISNIYSNWDESNIVILDRFYPSQAVYSILRGVDHMHHTFINSLDLEIANDGAVIIYLDTDLSILEQRYKLDGDEHIKMNHLSMLSERYEIFMKNTRLPVLRLNTLEKDWLKKVEEFINSHKR